MSAVLHLQTPTGGIAERGSRASVPKDQAYDLENFLVNQPGMLQCRGSLGDPTPNYNIDPAGVWVHGTNIMASATPTSKHADCAGGATPGAVTDVATGSTLVLSERSARLGDYAYGPSTDAATTLLRWNGTASAPTAMTDAPVGATDVCTHLHRLFVAGGAKPGTASPSKPNSLWWTDLGGPALNTLADWKDDVSGLVNEIVVGDDGEEIVALVSLGRQLLIFKTYSIWALIGDSPSSSTLRKVVSTMGLQTKTAVLAVDSVCIFVSADGIPMLYDGAELQRLRRDSVLTGGTTNLVRLPGDYFLFVRAQGSGIVSQGVLYLPTQSWTTFSFDSFVVLDGFRAVQTEESAVYFVSGRSIRPATNLSSASVSNVEKTEAGVSDSRIYPTVTYRLASLAVPSMKANVQRIFLDHAMQALDDMAGTARWKIDVFSTDALLPLVSFYTTGSTDLGFERHRSDAFVETADASVRLTAETEAGTPVIVSMSVQDLWLEYEPVQRF